MKLNSEITQIIVDSINAGSTIRVACRRAKIGEASYYRWYKRGRELYEMKDIEPDRELTTIEDAFFIFYSRVEEAHTNYSAKLLDEIMESTEKPSDLLKVFIHRYGNDLNTVVEYDSEPESKGTERLSHIEIHLKLIDDYAKELELTDEQVKSAKRRILGIYGSDDKQTSPSTNSHRVSDEEADEIANRLRRQKGLPEV